MRRHCFIGIDLGTSGCRAMAISETGQTLADAATDLPRSRHSLPGRSEQDPDAWWQAVVRVLRRLRSRLKTTRPLAIAIDGTSSTLLLCDGQGRPLTAGLMYDDQRAQSQALRLASLAPVESAVHGPGSSLAKLLFLLETGCFPSGVHALHQSEWLSAILCGRFDLGDENNCLKLGYDPVSRSWPEWISKLQLPPGVLPKVVPAGTPLGEITPDAALETGLPSGCQIIAGSTDSTAAALAAGLQRPGDGLTSLGSTLVTKMLVEKPFFSPEYGVYSHRIFDHWLVGGASNTGGTVLRQFFTDEEIAELSEQIDPARRLCLEYYPLPATGERFPINDPTLKPRIHPVPKQRARLLQALLEGITRIEKLAWQRLEALGAPPLQRILTSGGGSGNRRWSTLRQNMLGVPVTTALHQEAAFGAALIAWRGYISSQVSDC